MSLLAVRRARVKASLLQISYTGLCMLVANFGRLRDRRGEYRIVRSTTYQLVAARQLALVHGHLTLILFEELSPVFAGGSGGDLEVWLPLQLWSGAVFLLPLGVRLLQDYGLSLADQEPLAIDVLD